MIVNQANKAFDDYCQDPVVVAALAKAGDTITIDLLRDAFMRGASFGLHAAAAHVAPKVPA